MPIIGLGQLTLTDLNDAIISGTPPLNPTEGTLWIDENYSPKLLKKWNGTSWITIGEVMDEGTGETIEDITETLGNMANDNLLDYNERQVIKDKLTEILGYVIDDITSTMPTTATLETSKKGDFYSIRKQALNAGLLTNDSLYIAVATRYNELKTYLDGLTPVKPWDLREANKHLTISVAKATFRDKWLNYYNAVNALAEATAQKLKENVDNLEVGGRNFLSNGDFMIDIAEARWKSNYFGNTKEVVDISVETPPFQFAYHVNNTANINGGIFTPTILEGNVAEAMLGKEVTLTYWLKYQNIVQGTNNFNAGRFGELEVEGTKSDGTKVYAYYRVGTNNAFDNTYTLGTNMTWTKYSATLKIALPSGATKISKISFKHGLEGCKGEFWTTGLKLEIGNKATDWSADPLDMIGTITEVITKVLPDRIIQIITSSETYTKDLQDIENKVAKLLTLTTSSNLMTFDENNNFKPTAQIISITANTQNLTGTPTFTAIPYNASGTQLTAFTLEGTGNTRTLRTTHWLSTYDRVVVEANLDGFSDSVTIVKVKDGAKGNDGGKGDAGKDAIVGFLTNESVTLPANSSGTVTSADLAKATGTFEVYEGITKKTGTSVVYAKTAESGCTATINTSGVYSISAMSADQATATFTATYGGVVITKVLSLSKSRQGATGSAGKGVTSIVEEYYLSTSSTTQANGTWSATAPTWEKGKFIWTRSKTTYTDGTSSTTTPICVSGADGADGSNGADGLGISSVDVLYYLSTSATALAGGSWSTTAPTWVNGKYMWSKTKTTYSNGTFSESTAVCITGAKGSDGSDGKGVASATVTYQNHTNGTTAPTGTWSSTVPTPVKGQYMWARTVTTYTDGSSITTYSVSYNATDGQNGSDGKGIKSTAITYQLHTNGTTAPTGTWVASPPSPVKGQYLWTRTIITYTDNSTSTSYSTSYYATDGQNGKDGKDGVDGVSVTSIVEEYYHSTSATSLAGGSWSTTVPTWANNKYVWTRATTTFSNGTTSSTNPVNVTGSKGTDGTQRYTWVRYADDANGNGMADSPDGKRYIGIAVNQTSSTEGSSASAYTWSPLYDNVEIGGRNLAKIANWSQWGTGAVERTKYSYVLNSTSTSGVGISIRADAMELLPSKQYVFSFKIRKLEGTLNTAGGHTDATFSSKMFYKIDGVEQNVGFSSPKTVTALDDGNYHTVEYSFKTPATITGANLLYIQPNRASYLAGSIVEIKDLQIEQSNIASDWRPAPEDIQEDIDSKADSGVVETLTTEYNNKLIETAEELTRTLSQEIKDGDGEVIKAYQSELSATATNWNLSFTEITGKVNGLDGEMTKVNTYFDFSSNGLGIGKSDSPLQISISNEQIDFIDNGVAVAYINGKMMYIESLEILNSLLIGNHKIEKYNNEITLIKYSG
jgi:hypothetical protein